MTALNQLNAMDPNALADLKRLASQERNSPKALRAAAQQFEAMFLQMVMKAMRDATLQNGLFDSDQSRMFQGLHDQQVAMNLAQGRGIGLADAIFRQLGGEPAGDVPAPVGGPDGKAYFDLASVPRRPAIAAARAHAASENAAAPQAALVPTASLFASVTPSPDVNEAAASAGPSAPAVVAAAPRVTPSAIAERVRAFVARVWPHAEDAGQRIGVPPQFVVAQAALETGWGRAELRRNDGTPSYNLFNIKAGRNWKGPVVEVPVTEYANGRAYTETARFRVYDSYAAAFRDYTELLRNSERYRDVLNQTDAAGFARSLQEAGFATDPLYAEKITRIIAGPALRTARAG